MLPEMGSMSSLAFYIPVSASLRWVGLSLLQPIYVLETCTIALSGEVSPGMLSVVRTGKPFSGWLGDRMSFGRRPSMLISFGAVTFIGYGDVVIVPPALLAQILLRQDDLPYVLHADLSSGHAGCRFRWIAKYRVV